MSDYQIITAMLANIIYVAVIHKLLHIFFTTTRSRRQELALYAAAYVLLTAAYVLWQKPEVTIVSNIIVILGVTCFYQANWLRRFTATAFVYSMAFLCEMVVVEFVQLIGFSNYEDYTNREFVIVQIFCKSMTYLVASWLVNLDNLKDDQEMPANYSLIIFAVPVCMICPTYVLMNMAEVPTWQIDISVLMLFFINGLIFKLYDWLLGMYRKQLTLAAISEQNKMYRRQLETEQEANAKMSRLRHDWNNSLLPILGQLEAGQYQDAAEVLRGLMREIKNTKPMVTGIDPALAAVLNYKLADAQDMGIAVNHDIELPQDLHEHIDIQELSILLGNLLDNAIRAAASYHDGPQYIDLMMSIKLGVLLITIANPFDGHIVQKKNGQYETTKEDKDNHGLGLQTVQRIVEKYQGDLEIIPIENNFTVHVTLYLE